MRPAPCVCPDDDGFSGDDGGRLGGTAADTPTTEPAPPTTSPPTRPIVSSEKATEQPPLRALLEVEVRPASRCTCADDDGWPDSAACDPSPCNDEPPAGGEEAEYCICVTRTSPTADGGDDETP